MLYIVFIKLEDVYVKLNEKSGFLGSDVSPIFYSRIKKVITKGSKGDTVQILLHSQVIVRIK